MRIDVRGTTTVNRGALLMLMAIRDRMRDAQLSVAPGVDNYPIRIDLGLYQTLHHHRAPRASNLIGNAIPAQVRTRYGLVADKEIQGVLDASGFAYSDSFGAHRSRREALHGRAWGRRGVPRVLLPQAFGPFVDTAVRRWASEVISESALVYARDEVSRRHVEMLRARSEVRIAPDITIGLKGEGEGLSGRGGFALIVPNGKLVEKGTIEMSAYIRLLSAYAEASGRVGLTPIYLVHEATDGSIARAAAGDRFKIIDDENPLRLKAIIRDADVVITSRFHAAVSALSQSVPTLALGWSHKYTELMSQFGVPEWSLRLSADADASIRDLIEQSPEIRRELQARRGDLVGEVDRMWDDVRTALMF